MGLFRSLIKLLDRIFRLLYVLWLTNISDFIPLAAEEGAGIFLNLFASLPVIFELVILHS